MEFIKKNLLWILAGVAIFLLVVSGGYYNSFIAANNSIDGQWKVIVENYPELKSDRAVLRLQDELAGTENRVAVERRRYNELVQGYNTSVSVVPGNILAGVFGFKPRAYFNAAPDSENAPQVKF